MQRLMVMNLTHRQRLALFLLTMAATIGSTIALAAEHVRL